MNSIVSVIVTYNRKKLLRESIKSLLNQSYEGLDIYVVDNASTDGTDEYIQDLIDNNKVRYFNTNKNLGGAGGFQYGIRKAVKSGYEKIWIMDDDTICTPNALEMLLRADEDLNGEYGFICSDVKWTDGSPCAMNVPNIDNKWIQSTDVLQKGYIRCTQCSFVSCFFKASVVKEVGLPIKEFFVWGDDAEYTKRISDIYPSYFVPQSQVVHKIHSNIPTDISKDSPDRLFRYQFSYRNMYYVNKKQGNKLSMVMFYYGVFLDIKKILRGNVPGKGKKIKIILKSVRQGIKFNPKIEYVD